MARETLSVPPDLMGNVERYAVYRCYSDAGELLYVGESGDLGKRLAAHAQKAWFLQVRGITLEWHIEEIDALNAERRAIHVEHPRYNVVHRNAVTLQPAVHRNAVTLQPAAKPKQRRRQSAPTAAPPRSWEETREIVLALMQDEPGISSSEIGRRPGKTESFGRQVVRRIASERMAVA